MIHLTTEGKTGKERREVIAELFRLMLVEEKTVEYLCDGNWTDLCGYNSIIVDDEFEYRSKEDPMVVWALVVDGSVKIAELTEEDLDARIKIHKWDGCEYSGRKVKLIEDKNG